jgi:histidinol dehydrogenase
VRLECTVADARSVAARVRGVVAGIAPQEVTAIVEDVRERGDAAVLEHEARFGGGGPLIVPQDELAAAFDALDPAVRAGLKLAAANVQAVATAGVDPEAEVTLPEGQTVRLREVPVRRAAVYAPGGRHPYPSSVLMGAVTARAAGVEDIVVAAPRHPVILAACALCQVDEVYGMGGAQAIAALAYGTETVKPVDVIVGPGSLWVQEAKRQVSGQVGIDGFAGPSDLTIICSAGADPEPLRLDLLAQAEHGEESRVGAGIVDAAPGALALGGAVPPPAALLDAFEDAGVAVHAADMEAALAFAEALAPEHLQLAGAAAEALAPRVRSAGCLFVGIESGTAFGDYVAGSNHTLPTGGAARFASVLSPRHFRRRMAEVRVGPAAGALARAGAPIARAEGFELHARSMEIRENQPPT